MKKIIILLTSFIYSVLLKGQSTSLDIGSIWRIGNYALLSPTITLKHNKHSVYTGFDIVNKQGYFLTGYQYNPADSSKKLQVYFPVDFLFKSTKIHRYNNTRDENEHEIDSKISAGYGLKYYIFKGFNIHSQTTIGIDYTVSFYDQTINDEKKIWNRDSFNFNFFVQVGISYSIHLK